MLNTCNSGAGGVYTPQCKRVTFRIHPTAPDSFHVSSSVFRLWPSRLVSLLGRFGFCHFFKQTSNLVVILRGQQYFHEIEMSRSFGGQINKNFTKLEKMMSSSIRISVLHFYELLCGRMKKIKYVQGVPKVIVQRFGLIARPVII